MQDEDFRWLMKWYSDQCDGDWEHCYGIRIETIDNPGWSIKIPLSETNLAAKNFQKLRIDRSESDWVRCFVENDSFLAAGGPFNFLEILHIFRNWAEPEN